MFRVSLLARCVAALSTVATIVVMGACAEKSPAGADPVLPSNPPIPAQYRGAAFILDVSAVKKTVKISAPGTGFSGPISASRVSASIETLPSYSLLGGDVVDLSTSNFQAGALGATVPGKVLITFDLTINNRLAGVRLVTPTFPTPPSGVTGVQAFPFEISVTTTAGGVTSSGNEIVVASPRFGAVTPSDNWNGNFHNFFNDAACAVSDNDCFRYESFGAIQPLGASTAQQVGFLIDPTVGDFRVKVLLAADLENVTLGAGIAVGKVTSPPLGAIGGATVSVSGGFTATTSAGGAYTITGIAPGARTVAVTNLPAGCVAPASRSFTFTRNEGVTLDFIVTCTLPRGSIAGAITGRTSDGFWGGLPGVGVSVTPAGGVATPVVTTVPTTGAYTIANVPTLIANGVLTLTNVPSNCTNPGPRPYTNFTAAGLFNQNIELTCTPPPGGYPVSLTYGPILNSGPTGRQVRITVRWDAGTIQVVALQFQIGFSGTALAFASRRFESSFDFGAQNVTGAGTAASVLTAAYAAPPPNVETGAFNVVSFLFDITAGFSGSVTPMLSLQEALAFVPAFGPRRINPSLVPITPPGPIVIP